jgi:hypothetical protein
MPSIKAVRVVVKSQRTCSLQPVEITGQVADAARRADVKVTLSGVVTSTSQVVVTLGLRRTPDICR